MHGCQYAARRTDFKEKNLYGQGRHLPRLGSVVMQPCEPKSRNNILEILLSEIPQLCRSLANQIPGKIPELKRNGWAKEVEKPVVILHKHKTLWG